MSDVFFEHVWIHKKKYICEFVFPCLLCRWICTQIYTHAHAHIWKHEQVCMNIKDPAYVCVCVCVFAIVFAHFTPTPSHTSTNTHKQTDFHAKAHMHVCVRVSVSTCLCVFVFSFCACARVLQCSAVFCSGVTHNLIRDTHSHTHTHTPLQHAHTFVGDGKWDRRGLRRTHKHSNRTTFAPCSQAHPK